MTFFANFSLVLPEIVLAIAALVLLVAGAFRGKVGAIFTLAAVAALVAAAATAVLGPHGHAFGGVYAADAAATYAKVAIYLSSAVAVVLGDRWLAQRGDQKFEFAVLVILAAVGMGVTASAGDLISLYVGVELQSLALYVLAAMRRDDAKSSEAGLKYFVLGALSSGLLLYGSSLIYGFTGSTHFSQIALAAAHGGTHGVGLLFGLVFLICGLAFKVSAAPFHMWTPDVYEGAPTPVVALFATAPKVAAMVLIARVLEGGFAEAHAQWSQVLIAISLLSFVVGAFGGIAQKDIQRLLAYSSIANIGYALLGIAAGTSAGLQAMLMFMTLYVIDQLGFFAILLSLSKSGRPIRRIADLAGLKKDRPVTAVALTVLSLSVLGMPPLSGFWAKYYVFGAAASAGLWPVAAVGLVASVVAAFYYLRIIKLMWFDAPVDEIVTDKASPETSLIGWACAAFAFPLVIVGLTWLEPLTRVASAGFGNG